MTPTELTTFINDFVSALVEVGVEQDLIRAAYEEAERRLVQGQQATPSRLRRGSVYGSRTAKVRRMP